MIQVADGKIRDFAIFIQSHGRADRVYTLRTLEKAGNQQDVYIVVDDEDAALPEYVQRFGEDRVLVFSKRESRQHFDVMDNFRNEKAVVFARNECFRLARRLGLRYFLELDDDYVEFAYRIDSDGGYNRATDPVRDINVHIIKLVEVFDRLPEYVVVLSIAQGGDFVGGSQGGLAKTLAVKRKAMNWFICSVDREFRFVGRINEDVNTYVGLGKIGKVFLMIPYISLGQIMTQQNQGGMTDMYVDTGTYMKSFYTILDNPSCVKITRMGNKYRRLHHKIEWEYAVPKIISAEVEEAPKSR